MSWRLYRPRPISAYEARIIRRLLQVGASAPASDALLASVDHLVVREEGDGGAENDSLEFEVKTTPGAVIAHGLGVMTNDGQVELLLWARDDVITQLELEPFAGARLPTRMPILETIGAYPEDGHLL